MKSLSRLEVFIANWTNIALEKHSPIEWYHMPGNQNPGDLGTQNFEPTLFTNFGIIAPSNIFNNETVVAFTANFIASLTPLANPKNHHVNSIGKLWPVESAWSMPCWIWEHIFAEPANQLFLGHTFTSTELFGNTYRDQLKQRTTARLHVYSSRLS